NEAKVNIRRIKGEQLQEVNNRKDKFLEDKVFYGLQNLNKGFDSPSIKYFSESDFEIVLKRVEKHKIGIKGIEPWLNNEFYDVAVVEDYGGNPFEPTWYKNAFYGFKKDKSGLQYSATYDVPEKLLKEK